MGLLGGRLKDDWGRGWLESEVHLRPIGKGVKVGEGGTEGWTEIELGRRPSLDPYSRRGGGAQPKKRKRGEGQSEKKLFLFWFPTLPNLAVSPL